MSVRQVLVLGVHRSGTSALAETGARLGLFPGDPGDLDTGDRWNEKGYWENRKVRAVNEELLAAADTDWFCASAWEPARLPRDDGERLSATAEAVVRALDAHAPWIAKDPRMCVLLPFWLPLLSAPAFLFSLRSPLSVARSLRARDGFPIPLGISLWEVQILSALGASRGFPRAAFWYEELVASPARETERLRTWLREEAGIGSVDLAGSHAAEARLNHHVASSSEEDERLPRSVRRLLAALRTGEAFRTDFDTEPSEDAREVLAFADREARTRRFLDRGWRAQKREHGEAVRSYEEAIRLKDEYIADLRTHLGIRSD